MKRSEILNIAKPILFNTEMVRAILCNRKTVTRRVIKLKYDNTHIKWFENKYGRRLVEMQNDVENETFGKYPDGTNWHKILACRELKPKYKVGDYLYVRETWRKFKVKKPLKAIPYDYEEMQYSYKSDGNIANSDGTMVKWRPSTNMPKEAARIFLKVTAVRVERLQDITWVGILHEGIKDHMITDNSAYSDICKTKDFDNYKLLWNSTLKKSDYAKYGWEANPWVWVYEFEKVEADNG